MLGLDLSQVNTSNILYEDAQLAFLTTTFLGYFHFSQTSVNNDNNVKSNFPK